KPGVFLNPKEKNAVIGQYRRALKEKIFIQRSKIANQSCLSYIYTTANQIIHSSSKNSIDPSGAGAEHGDLVIADALANKALDLIGNKRLKQDDTHPVNCWRARKDAAEALKKKEEEW
ncbi:unnamed protein product, partial [marine sediment metagenome]